MSQTSKIKQLLVLLTLFVSIFSFSSTMKAQICDATFSHVNLQCAGIPEVEFIKAIDAGGSALLWDFGNGTSSTALNPTHTYSSEGTYLVELAVNGTCSASTNIYVRDCSSQGEIQFYADQCIAEYGEASLIARSLTGTVDDQAWGEADICSTNGNSTNLDAQNSIRIYPSVSFGPFTFDFENLLEHQGGTLSIYNINGKLILQDDIEKGTKSRHIDLSLQPAGIYSVKLKSTNH